MDLSAAAVSDILHYFAVLSYFQFGASREITSQKFKLEVRGYAKCNDGGLSDHTRKINIDTKILSYEAKFQSNSN